MINCQVYHYYHQFYKTYIIDVIFIICYFAILFIVIITNLNLSYSTKMQTTQFENNEKIKKMIIKKIIASNTIEKFISASL